MISLNGGGGAPNMQSSGSFEIDGLQGGANNELALYVTSTSPAIFLEPGNQVGSSPSNPVFAAFYGTSGTGASVSGTLGVSGNASVGGLSVGATSSTVSNLLVWSNTANIPAVVPGSTGTTSIIVSGVTPGGTVLVSPSSQYPNALVMAKDSVVGSGTIQILWNNPTTSSTSASTTGSFAGVYFH